MYFLKTFLAKADQDYYRLNSTLQVIHDGLNPSKQVCWTIFIIDDQILEGNQSFTVSIRRANQFSLIALSDHNEKTITIIDNG